MTELLTTKEIASFLKLRPETVLRKVKKGEIPAIKIGGRFRYDESQIEEWLRYNSTSNKDIFAITDRETTKHLLRKAQRGSSYEIITAQAGANI